MQEMAYSEVDWRCTACWRTNKANTKQCAKCGIKWTHGNDPTYMPQKDVYKPKSPRRGPQSSSWSYSGWGSENAWGDASWAGGYYSGKTQKKSRGSTPRRKTPKGKKQQESAYSVPPPEPPWHANYAGDAATSTPAGEEAVNENLVILALKEANTPVPEKVQHIVAEHSAPMPTSKSLKNAVDKMDKARKKLREAQKARANLHSSWRKYIADSLSRWTQFAEQFAKDDQDLAEKVRLATDKLQQSKEDVENKKNALEELDTEIAEEITDDEMTDKLDSSETIATNITNMVASLQQIQQKAEAEIPIRPRSPRTSGRVWQAEKHSSHQMVGLDQLASNHLRWRLCAARQTDLKEVCLGLDTGSQAVLLNWSHSILQETNYKSTWAASIDGLDLAWEVGTLTSTTTTPSCTTTSLRPKRSRATRGRSVFFKETQETYVGHEDSLRSQS